jgi:pyruvate/2-oxoglutarate dehydrogenase complex dihydrolipoamide dehydrogenase (E3) component
MAQAFARFGSKVHLIEMDDRILVHEDRDAASLIEQALVKEGITVHLKSTLTHVKKKDHGKEITVHSAAGDTKLIVDQILLGAGRIPTVRDLGLEAAGVDFDEKQGVKVDHHLRTTNPRIYAAGDVCVPHKFTHVADATARLVTRNALFCGRSKYSSLIIPWCTYTDPEVAHVGMYAHDAREKGIEVTTFTVEFPEVDRALMEGDEGGFVKVFTRKGTDKILGATVVAAHAGEMISEITALMVAGKGLNSLSRTIHCYPTEAEAFKKAADSYNRTRLKPWIKRLFQRWLAWRR